MKKFTFPFIFLFVFLMGFIKPVFAINPHLELSPNSGIIDNITGLDIAVKIDTGGQEVKSAKAVINFDETKLEVISITAGSFFDEVSHNIYNSTGQVVINTNFSLGSSLESKTGTGILATMSVKSKITSGSANMTFDCVSENSTDSGINNTTPIDIIICDSNVNGSYNLDNDLTSSSPLSSPLPTPSILPIAGTTNPTILFFVLGVGLILFSYPLFLFTK